jgi:hypothetical protein
MSIKAMSAVWEHYTGSGPLKLVLLALADWCNDEGESLHPSHDAVARKCNVSRSQVVRILRHFTQVGLLEVVGNAHGGAPGTTKRYRLRWDMLLDPLAGLTGSTGATGSADATGSTGAARRVAPRPRRVAPVLQTGSTHATQTTREPSLEPPVESAPKKEPTATLFGLDSLPAEWEKFCREKRPDLDPMQTFEIFADYWRGKDKKFARKSDWFATWRNWCRNEKRATTVPNRQPVLTQTQKTTELYLRQRYPER